MPLRWIVLFAAVFVLAVRSSPGSDSSKLDLNLLQTRVTEFWSLVQKNQRAKALSFVAEENQDEFLNWRPLPIRRFEIAEIHLGETPESAVTVHMKIRAVTPVGSVNWPRDQEWVFRDENWYVKATSTSMTEAMFGRANVAPAGSPGKDEVAAALKKFRFGTRRLGLQDLKKGDIAWREINYQNPSDLPITVTLVEAPSWIGVERNHFVAQPGEQGRLLLGFFTEALEGEFRGKVRVAFSHGEERRTQEFAVAGFVIAPFEVVPGHLIVQPHAKESLQVIVRNNSQEPLEVAEVFSSASFVRAEWPADEPRMIQGESEAVFAVHWDPADAPQNWTTGTVTIRLAGGPVIEIPVLRKFP